MLFESGILAIAFNSKLASRYSVAHPMPTLDVRMLFGFLASIALIAAVTLPESYRARITRAVCYLAVAWYAFSAGVWPIGLALLFVGVRELVLAHVKPAPREKSKVRNTCARIVHQNRVTKLTNVDSLFSSDLSASQALDRTRPADPVRDAHLN